jgi:sugar lactone lactonase YvrE
MQRLIMSAALVALCLSLTPGCGGKYEMPTETAKDARLGEYVHGGEYGWFEAADHMAMIYGHIYVAFSDEGAVKRYYGDGDPERDIVFSGLDDPFVIGVGSEGIAVADSSGGMTVKVYPLDGGEPVLSFSDPDWEMIGGLAIDGDGNIYVSDMVRNFVRSYKPDGKQRFGVDLADSGFGIGHVLSPRGLWIDGETLLIAEADGEKNQVQRVSISEPQKGIMFSSEIPLLSSFTDDEGNEWILDNPSAVTADSDGNVYVMDDGLGKLFRFTAEGVSDAMVNSPDAGGPTTLADPVAIGEYKNRIYTLERATGTIHRWDAR